MTFQEFLSKSDKIPQEDHPQNYLWILPTLHTMFASTVLKKIDCILK